MRTLNRPMFRYGGPIKEGVMNGIREPKRNGGSMSNNEGPRRAALVGNDVFPRTGGRENHLVQIPIGAAIMTGIGTAARAGARYIPRGINYLKNLARNKTGTKSAGTVRIPGAPGTPGRFTNQGSTVVNKAGPVQNIYEPNFLGRDPTVRLVGGIYRGVTSPTSKGVLQSTARFVISPTGLATGVIYAGGKYFNKKGEPVPKPKGDIKLGDKVGTSGAPGGGNPDMKYNEPGGYVTDAEKEAATIASRKKQMDMYKEIMDIKGMKKDATYKSLIDASQAILAEDDFKGSIKDGSLISKLIGVTSKRFDKVSDTETALRSLVAKGEIDKDLNKDKNALDNAVKNAQLTTLNKNLKGVSTGEIIQKTLGRAGGEYPQGDALRQTISINNPELNAKVLPTGDIPQGMDALDYITQQITTINNDETTPDYPEGFYVIKDRIIKVIDGKVIPVSINQLK